MLKRIYLEITNRCNLACSFCHQTAREPRSLTPEEFEFLTDRLRGKTDLLFLHLMGEPLLHPDLADFIRIAERKGFRPAVTTNGTLLASRGGELLDTPLNRVSISLHAPEANLGFTDPDYLREAIAFGEKADRQGIYVAYRLWNRGGLEENNPRILQELHRAYPGEWRKTRNGAQLAEKTYLERTDEFTWPDPSAPEHSGELFCYALREQIGILCDGSVVPCCLDADGNMTLGNLFVSPLEEILRSERARRMYDAFTAHRAEETLCRHCGYAAEKRHRAREI
jgi:radical SAM protein with 4Fe4S-binding SPASM domain